ncbi:MAG: AmmeMemoRadiSam system protein B [Sulfuricurvum sp.]|nr:AmmeMemoRadiSam system protein B [Sulfuricurvum sp.]
MNTRTMSVSGSFYPESQEEITGLINYFNSIIDANVDIVTHFNALSGNAVIVPHAGWVYSGFTANLAHRILAQSKPKNIIVIGPSHRVSFEGISIADMQKYQTPLGYLSINTSLVNDIKEKFSLLTLPEAHQEHSTEVQMPFIKHYLGEANVVELIYSYAEPIQLSPIIDYLLDIPETAVVISTDLSHYYPLEEAQKLDTICLEAIKHKNSSMLHQGCEACGKIGVEAMLDIAVKRDMNVQLLDYRTSADASKDASRVVGYTSALFR